MYQGVEAVQGLSRMQWVGGEEHLSEAERHHKARVLAMVSSALDQAYAESRREHIAVEEWEHSEFQVCGSAGEADRGFKVKLVVSYI